MCDSSGVSKWNVFSELQGKVSNYVSPKSCGRICILGDETVLVNYLCHAYADDKHSILLTGRHGRFF